MWEGIGVGFAVATLNGLAAWLILRYGLSKGGNLFMQIFLGGMVGRLLLVSATCLLLLLFTSIHRVAFTGSLMGGYVLFLIAEVAYILKKGVEKQQEKGGGTAV